MDITWRTLQLFLGDEGISEVSFATHDKRKLRCTCLGFSSIGKCKHTRFVKACLDKPEGNYAIQIPYDIPEEEADIAMETEEAWREFILKYGKVETID